MSAIKGLVTPSVPEYQQECSKLQKPTLSCFSIRHSWGIWKLLSPRSRKPRGRGMVLVVAAVPCVCVAGGIGSHFHGTRICTAPCTMQAAAAMSVPAPQTCPAGRYIHSSALGILLYT
jgi:hypothetical protein